MPTAPFPSPRAVLVAALLAACSTPTDVDPATLVLHPVTLRTAEEWNAWPGSPEIEGGETVRVRGMVFVGCGDVGGRVVRRDDVVGIEITAIARERYCLQSMALWVPFDATVSGLRAGTYRVRVAATGVRAIVEETVVVP